MSVITDEVDKLSIMYEGDKNRDASDKIRGFLFQDYIAIMCLLDNQVEYVCSEYLEDVDVFLQNGKFLLIQAKYYPNTTPNKKEIFTDLYYQYLRLKMLKSKLTPVPCLFIHRTANVVKPTFDEMKGYIGKRKKLPTKKDYPNEADVKQILKKEIYSSSKKEEQKEKLFSKMASEESLKNFLANCKVILLPNINIYKTQVEKALANKFPVTDVSIDKDKWQMILLGLSISYIQHRYTLKDPDFNQLKINKKDFEQHIIQTTQTTKKESIVYYLISIAFYEYSTIISRNSLSDLQAYMLKLIYQDTVKWIEEIGRTNDGQYKLFYTISNKEISEIIEYKGLPVKKKLEKFMESREGFEYFLNYLWKIMLDICQEEIDDVAKISAKLELFNPSYYMVDSVKDYVCFYFPEDKKIKHAVILPAVGGKFNAGKRKIVDRMIRIEPKPGKWFMENSEWIWGKNYYNYSTANVCENPTVVDLGEDAFYVECMKCIGIDEGQWNVPESCSTCIFSEKCVREGKDR